MLGLPGFVEVSGLEEPEEDGLARALVRSATHTMPWSRSTLTAAARPVAGTTMQRTQSSLLSFNLRDFLDAADEVPMATIAEGEEESALRMVAPYQVELPAAADALDVPAAGDKGNAGPRLGGGWREGVYAFEPLAPRKIAWGDAL